MPCLELGREGVIVIRLWTEGASPDLPRARITALADLISPRAATTTIAAAGVPAILANVRDLLDEFAGGQTRDQPDAEMT